MKDYNQRIKISVPKKPILNLEAFVLQNHAFMTLADMEEETGFTPSKFYPIFSKLGVRPIGQRQKINNFIMEHYRTKSKKWMMKVCNMSDSQINTYYHELGISEPKKSVAPEVRVKTGKSVSQILSNVYVPRNI